MALEAHNALGIGKGQRAEQDAIDYRENSSIGADAERQGKNGDDRETGALNKGTEGVADVTDRILHESLYGSRGARVPPDLSYAERRALWHITSDR
jgi:hypothetical protein